VTAAGEGDGSIVVVSNRGPLAFTHDDEGRLVPTDAAGGLAGTLHPLFAQTEATWVAAAVSDADRQAADEGRMVMDPLRLVTVRAEDEQYRLAYDVVCNATLWFCHHHLFDLPRRPRFDRRWPEAWEAYRALNAEFAGTVAEVAPEGAAVLVQDYHLCLTGALLRQTRPDLRTVHFTHTPFADPNVLRIMPADTVDELLRGMAGFDGCGFHSTRWAAAFRAAYDGSTAAAGAAPSVPPPPTFTAPLGVDLGALTRDVETPECSQELERLEAEVGDRRLIVRVDRIELSKNLVRGFLAFDELLERRPDWRGRVVFLALAYASRETLADYLAYRSEVEHAAERINERWGTEDYTPIALDVGDHRSRSLAALVRCDVLLVNPVRDGLNLVAKEGPVINRRDGVLVLSRESGAWEELHSGALGVNPFDLSETAAALERALEMPPAERSALAVRLRELATARSAEDWLRDQLAQVG
jgi:trehalose 6-phosphate synthase